MLKKEKLLIILTCLGTNLFSQFRECKQHGKRFIFLQADHGQNPNSKKNDVFEINKIKFSW